MVLPVTKRGEPVSTGTDPGIGQQGATNPVDQAANDESEADGIAAGSGAVPVQPRPPAGRFPVLVAWQRHGLGVLMALATLTLLTWRVERPALWLDESASVVATQRSWSNLWLLFRGADAPLAPYYALLKATTGVITTVAPGTAEHPELLFRLPSVLAVVIAVWALTVWLARYAGAPMVIGSGVVLLATAGLSRYGQEARPYGVVLLATTFCMIAWTRMVQDRSRRRAVLYTLSVVLLVAANSLAATLVVAHLVTALVLPDGGRRWWAVRRTLLAALAGLLLATPVVVLVTFYGKGAARYPAMTTDNLWLAFIHLFTIGHPFLWVGGLLPLALLGLIRVISVKYQFIARVAISWAIVPPLLLLPAVMIRPNLLIGRYLLFVVPGWAILGGLGVVTVVELGRRVTGRLALPALLALTLLGGAVFTQVPSLTSVRETGGHSEDIRPALATADAPANAQLPIFVTTRNGAVEVGAYDRRDEARLLGTQVQRDHHSIWPRTAPLDLRMAQLRRTSRMLLLMRDNPLVPGCLTESAQHSKSYVQTCMPELLQRMGFQVEWVAPGGRHWTMSGLVRVLPPAPVTVHPRPKARPKTTPRDRPKPVRSTRRVVR